MSLVRVDVRAAPLSRLKRGNDQRPTRTSTNPPPPHPPHLLNLHLLYYIAIATAAAAATTPLVCLAVTQSAMCALKMLHNALLSPHSGSKRTIHQRKNCSLLLPPFFLIVLRPDFPLDPRLRRSALCRKCRKRENDQRLYCKRKKPTRLESRPRCDRDAPGAQILCVALSLFCFDVLSLSYLL